MKKLFLFLLLIGTIYSQDDQPDRLVRQSEFTDSLNSLRTLIGTGGVPLPDSVIYTSELAPYVDKTTSQTITGQKNFSGLVNFPDTNDVLIQLSNPSQAPYGNFYLRTGNMWVNTAPRPDNVVSLGWNTAFGGGREIPRYGSMALEFESYYDGNGYGAYETHIAFLDSVGTIRRPISIEGRPDNGYTSLSLQFTQFGFRDENNSAYLQGDNDGWDYHYQFQHRFEIPNYPIFTVVNYDSTATLNFPYFNADNHLYFGDYHSTFYRSITADTVYANNFVGAGNEIANVFETVDFFTPSESNYLYAANSRFTVSDSNFTYNGSDVNSVFFDNSYTTSFGIIDANEVAKLEIDLSTKSELTETIPNTLNITSGYILVNMFGINSPDSVCIRFYKPMTGGWVRLPSPTEISKTGTRHYTYRFTIPADTNYYYISKIECMIYNGDSTMYVNDINYFLSSPFYRNFANVDKHRPQSFYYRTSWKNFNNTEVAYIDSSGNADFKTLSINGILQTGSGAIGNADSLGAIPANQYLLKSDSTIYLTPSDARAEFLQISDSTIYLTPSDAASAYASKSHTHTEFFDTLAYSVNIPDTVIAGDNAIWKVPNNITIVEVSAFTNTGTVTFNIEERGETTPNTAGTDVITSDLVADTDQQETTTFSNATLDKNDWMALVITSITGDPTLFGVTIYYVKTN